MIYRIIVSLFLITVISLLMLMTISKEKIIIRNIFSSIGFFGFWGTVICLLVLIWTIK